MKVSELEGAKLDYWVAVAETLHRPKIWNFEEGDRCVIQKMSTHDIFSPSTDWAQGGPIIDREEIELVHRNGMDGQTLWAIKENVIMRGETKLIAAMRAFVASKFGDEVDDS